jgi:hypothetical protein
LLLLLAPELFLLAAFMLLSLAVKWFTGRLILFR